MNEIIIFKERLKKLNIKIEISCNVPWVYLDKINGKKVSEKFMAKYGFTIAFLPIRNDQKIQFTNISKIFQLIRQYLNYENRITETTI